MVFKMTAKNNKERETTKEHIITEDHDSFTIDGFTIPKSEVRELLGGINLSLRRIISDLQNEPIEHAIVKQIKADHDRAIQEAEKRRLEEERLKIEREEMKLNAVLKYIKDGVIIVLKDGRVSSGSIEPDLTPEECHTLLNRISELKYEYVFGYTGNKSAYAAETHLGNRPGWTFICRASHMVEKYKIATAETE